MANLLESASVVLTPTAYNNGKALCIKPDDGSGDFDFSRNSAATRVNAQGLIEDVQILSSNLVQNGDFSQTGSEEITNGNFSQQGSQLITNGDFATDSDWTKGTGWSISGGTANYDGLQASQLLRQGTANGVVGKTFLVKYDVVNNSGVGGIQAKFGGVNLSNYNSNNGRFEFYIVAVSTDYIRFIPQLDFNGSIDNVSVKEVGQNWTLISGVTYNAGGYLDFDGSQGNGSVTNTPNTTFTLNKTYKVVYEIKNYTNGTIKFRFQGGSNTIGQQQSGDGVKTEYIVCNDSSNNNFNFFGSSSFIGSIDNVSVKEVGQNWFKDANWSIGDNVATSTGAGRMFQSISALEGNTGTKVKVSFNITEVTSGGVKVDCYGAASSVITEVGTHTFTGTTTNSLNLYINNSGTGNLVGSITNISVIEITDDTNLPRINYEGFSFQDALGSELVLNGDFDTDSDWNLGGSDTPIIENGFLKFGISNGTYSRARQNNASIIGNCKVTYTVVNSSASTLSIREYSGGNSESVPATIGTHTIYKNFTANGVSFQAGGVDGGILEIDNISIKEVLGKEVVPDSGCGNWLWEPQTTSLVTYSEDFTQWASLGGTVTYVSDLVNPDGSLGGYKISGSGIYLALNLLSTTERNIYARTVSGTGTAQLLSHNTNTNNAFSLTEDWKRFDINSSPASAVANFYIDLRGAASTLTELYVWGANATNDQDYPTSYIPADGTSVTRNKDVCTNGGSVSTINSTEGVLYAQIAALANDGTNRRISVSDGSTSNRVDIRYIPASGQIQAVVVSGGSTQAIITESGLTTTDFAKVAIKYKQNDFALWINGVEAGTDTSGNTFPANTLNSLQFNSGGGSNNFFGKTKALAVFPFLTDTQLAELTTI